MRRNYVFNTVSRALPALFDGLIHEGDEIGSRIGPTKELAFTGITLTQPEHRELLVPGRKHNLAAQIAETMWVLAGRNDVKWLSNYLPRAKDYSDNGKTWRSGYGPRIRMWEVQDFVGTATVDQLGYVVDLLRNTPSSRQAVINIWKPGVDSTPGKDIACNNWLHFLSRNGKLDLHVAVRSNDAMWGWSGINVFEWSTLLEIVSGLVGLDIGNLHFSISSFHLYEQHWEKAARIARDGSLAPLDQSPRFDATGLDDMDALHTLFHAWFVVEKRIRDEAESMGHLSAGTEIMIDDFYEPMLQSWLRVLAWWWTGDKTHMIPIERTNLGLSASLSVQPERFLAEPVVVAGPERGIEDIIEMSRLKGEAYGDSWCRRGEMFSIMPNIGRKVDRITNGGSTPDESQRDTCEDLFVYSALYMAWLMNNESTPAPGAHFDIMRRYAEDHANSPVSNESLVKQMNQEFDELLDDVRDNRTVAYRMRRAASLLYIAWEMVLRA